jgi:hypothetical protein
MKNLRILLLTLMFMRALAAFAQPGPLTVVNNTGCDVQVAAFSHVAGSAVCAMFPAGVFCLAPFGGTVVIPPPGGPFDLWSQLDATAFLPSGCALCPSPLNQSSPPLAACFPPVVPAPDGCGCNGGVFTANWLAPNLVHIN